MANGLPFHCTTALWAKPVPLTVSVNADAPAVVVLGLSEVMFTPIAIGKPMLFELLFCDTTLIGTVPVTVSKLAGTIAVS